jgi:2-(1,2-epoxy-1,2-dihydrophenyl)acetyl-CoA isomerase
MSELTAPILIERSGAIARLRFNRPAALNTIGRAMAEAFLDACHGLRDDPAMRVVLLSAEGKAFMAGGDVVEIGAVAGDEPQRARAIIEPLHKGLAILASLPQPVIASVHGAVAGAGVSIALACDLCIAADDTRFNLAYARIGASPDASASWSLPRVVGLRKAMELMLLCENVDAAEALRLGMVNRVVARAELEHESMALAQRLAAGPTVALGHTKRLLRTSFENNYVRQLDAEQEAFCASAASADFGEGLAAFFAKRRAAFSGA